MVRKSSIYSLATVVWMFATFGITVAILSGEAAPIISPSELPGSGPVKFFGVPVVLIAVGATVISRFEKRSWRTAGRRAGLTPEGRSLIGKPDLTGTVDGRSVRVRTISRRTGGGGESGSNKTTFTVVETELREPVENGLVISEADTGEITVGAADAGAETVTVGDFRVLGGSENLVRDLLTQRVQSALRDPARLDSVTVGNAAGIMADMIPDADGMITGMLTGGMKKKLKDKYDDDATTVSTETKRAVLDGDELRRQAAAVAAVADEFESLTQ